MTERQFGDDQTLRVQSTGPARNQGPSLSAAAVFSLQRSAGNRAVATLLQRSPKSGAPVGPYLPDWMRPTIPMPNAGPATEGGHAGNEEHEGEDEPLEGLEAGVNTVDRAKTAWELAHEGGEDLSELMTQEEAKYIPYPYAEPGLSGEEAVGGATGVALGGVQMFLGGKTIHDAIDEGDVSKGVTGTADVVGGAANMAAPFYAPAGPVGAAIAVGTAAKKVTEFGMSESEYDRPGTVADWTQSAQDWGENNWLGRKSNWIGKPMGAAAALPTFIGSSLIHGGAAFGEGLYGLGKRLASPINYDKLRKMAALGAPQAPKINIPIPAGSEETSMRSSSVANEDAPPPAPVTKPARRRPRAKPIREFHRQPDLRDYAGGGGLPYFPPELRTGAQPVQRQYEDR